MPLTIEYRPFVLPDPVPVATSVPFAANGTTARPRWLRPGALAALGAVAIIGPLSWDGTALRPPAAQASPSRLQPFETAGENFPGSAFYYLDSDSGVVPAVRSRTGSGATSDLPAPLDARLGDAIARPTFLSGSAEDRFRALHCLTTAIYYEAASEPDAGQRAVAQVVLNRVAQPQWPNSVCGVVFQGSERPGCQFSFACDGSMARAPVRMWWDRARRVAERALAGEVYAPVGLATYYHTGAVNPVWAAHQTFIGAIGAHLFYRPPGGAGAAGAFTDRDWGGEPSPAPQPRVSPSPALQTDPLAVAQEWAVRRARTDFGRVTPAIIDSAALLTPGAYAPAAEDALPASGQIRPEYRDSGRWIASPKG
jgi:hypothetical protein